MNWDRIFLTVSILFSMVVGRLAYKTHMDQAVIYAQIRLDLGTPDKQNAGSQTVGRWVTGPEGNEIWVKTGFKRYTAWQIVDQNNGQIHDVETKLQYTNKGWFLQASEIDQAELAILGDPRFYNLLRLYLFQADLDGDGFKNIDDYCPQIPGVKNETGDWTHRDGCPIIDSDEDDVPDYRDACPNGTKKDVQGDDVTYYGLIQDVKPSDSTNGCSLLDLIATCNKREWSEPDANGVRRVNFTECKKWDMSCAVSEGRYTDCSTE